MELCFPAIGREIDWTRGFEFLDTELHELLRGGTPGRQHVDKLVKVHLLDGEPRLILVHLEVQHWPEGAFPARLYSYHTRLSEKGLPVVTVAILADSDPKWRPSHYERDLLGCRVQFDFPVCKLLDLVEKQEKLSRDHAAPVLLVLANWASQQTGRDARARFNWKLRLMRQCLDEGFSSESIRELYRFIDWVLELSGELEQEFRAEIIRDASLMPYVTSFERQGEARGREQGREEGLLAGQIIVCREILALPPLSMEQLTSHSVAELQIMLTDLKGQVAERLKD